MGAKRDDKEEPTCDITKVELPEGASIFNDPLAVENPIAIEGPIAKEGPAVLEVAGSVGGTAAMEAPDFDIYLRSNQEEEEVKVMPPQPVSHDPPQVEKEVV